MLTDNKEQKDVVKILEDILKYEKGNAKKRATFNKEFVDFYKWHNLKIDANQNCDFSVDKLKSDYTDSARVKKMMALFDSIKAIDKEFYLKVASSFRESFNTMQGFVPSETLKRQISDIALTISFTKDAKSFCKMAKDLISEIEFDGDEKTYAIYGLLVSVADTILRESNSNYKEDLNYPVIKANIEKFLAKLAMSNELKDDDLFDIERALVQTTFEGKPTIDEFEAALELYLEERQRKVEEAAKRVVVFQSKAQEGKEKVAVAQSSKKYEKPYLNSDAYNLLESYIGMIEEIDDLTRFNFPPDAELAHKGIDFDEFMTGVLHEERRKAALLYDYPNKHHEQYAKIVNFYAEFLIGQEGKAMQAEGENTTRELVKTRLNGKR